MAEVKWIKLSVGLFDDAKIKLIKAMPDGNSLIVIWCELLCLAGKINDNGYIYMGQNLPYTDEMLATVLGEPVQTVRLALDIFAKLNMIKDTPDGLLLVNWAVHQDVERLDRLRELGRKRVAAFRAKQLPPPSEPVTEPCNVTVTLRNATDKSRLDKTRQDKVKKVKAKKVNYAEWVRLTTEEYQKLVDEHGETGADWCIAKLNTYKGSSGKSYKSDYFAIRSWVVDEYRRSLTNPAVKGETQQQKNERALREMLEAERRKEGKGRGDKERDYTIIDADK